MLDNARRCAIDPARMTGNLRERLRIVEAAKDNSSISAQATVRDWLGLLRPAQWVKNVVVFAGPAAALKLDSVTPALQAFGAFVAFCLVASGTYAINDVLDREADARHPTKRNRPVARGVIQPRTAVALAGVLVLAALLGSVWALNRSVTVVLLVYLAMTLSYSAALKGRRDKMYLSLSYCGKEIRGEGYRTAKKLLESLDELLQLSKQHRSTLLQLS